MRARLLLGSVLSVLLLASPGLLVTAASAKPVWTPPAQLARTYSSDVAIAGNSKGDQVAVWGDEGVYGSFRPAGGAWGKPAPISKWWPETSELTVELDAAGNATVAWLAVDYGPIDRPYMDLRLEVARGDAEGGWGEPEMLSDQPVGQAPALALEDEGRATVAWTDWDPDSSRRIVETATRAADGTWSTTRVADGEKPQLARAAGGELDMVWWRDRNPGAPGDGDVLTATRSSGAAWSEPVTLGSVGEGGTTPRIVSNSAGNVTAAWTTCITTGDSHKCEVKSATKPASGVWAAPATISSTAGTLTAPVLAVAGDGDVTAGWVNWDTRQVMASRGKGPVWEPASVLSSGWGPGGASNQLDLAADRSGNVVATWSPSADQIGPVAAAYRPAGGTWQKPVPVALGVAEWQGQRTPRVTAGPDRFTVVFGGDATWFSDRVDDVTAPTARLVKPSRAAVTGTNVRVAWRAQDDAAGVARVMVRRRAALYNGSFGDWAVWKRTTASAATFGGSPGRTYCFSVKAIDRAGNRGRWSAARCAATPVDDRAARVSGGWLRVKDARSFRGTETVTNRAGQRMYLSGVKGRRLFLEATTCPGCGVVTVRLGKRDLGGFSLRSAKVRHRRLLPLASFTRVRSGRLVIRVASSGKPVRVDGIVVAR